MGLISLIRAILPLSRSTGRDFEHLKEFFDKKELREIKKILKQKSIGIAYTSLGISPWLITDLKFPQMHLAVEDKGIGKNIKKWNDIVTDRIKRRQILEFGKIAEQRLPACIATNIEGMDMIKHAAALQLVSTERIHILLLGDPGTGKTDIIRTASELHDNSTYGLGSGTSGVGLTVSVKGKNISPGLLPLADRGICALDELNLIKQKDLGSLYNAMEKGFVTYNKSDKKLTFDAKVRIIATANPKGDRFVGKGMQILKQQIPFDPALLTRFHLVFFIRTPNIDQFVAITKKIVENKNAKLSDKDIEFIKEFVDYAEDINVEFPKDLKTKVVEFAKSLKENEEKYFVDISPRIVHGIIRIAQANARMSLRRKVLLHDLEIAQKIMRTSLEVAK